MKVGARFYDPTIGRWIQRDPILSGVNWWVYCENDPVNQVDPNGKFIQALVPWVLYVILGAAIAVAIEQIIRGLCQEPPDIPHPEKPEEPARFQEPPPMISFPAGPGR